MILLFSVFVSQFFVFFFSFGFESLISDEEVKMILAELHLLVFVLMFDEPVFR